MNKNQTRNSWVGRIFPVGPDQSFEGLLFDSSACLAKEVSSTTLAVLSTSKRKVRSYADQSYVMLSPYNESRKIQINCLEIKAKNSGKRLVRMNGDLTRMFNVLLEGVLKNAHADLTENLEVDSLILPIVAFTDQKFGDFVLCPEGIVRNYNPKNSNSSEAPLLSDSVDYSNRSFILDISVSYPEGDVDVHEKFYVVLHNPANFVDEEFSQELLR